MSTIQEPTINLTKAAYKAINSADKKRGKDGKCYWKCKRPDGSWYWVRVVWDQ